MISLQIFVEQMEVEYERSKALVARAKSLNTKLDENEKLSAAVICCINIKNS